MTIADRIDKELENVITRTGAMGTETVHISLEVTNCDIEKFLSLEKYDSKNYYWSIEKLNDGRIVLCVSFTEEV